MFCRLAVLKQVLNILGCIYFNVKHPCPDTCLKGAQGLVSHLCRNRERNLLFLGAAAHLFRQIFPKLRSAQRVHKRIDHTVQLFNYYERQQHYAICEPVNTGPTDYILVENERSPRRAEQEEHQQNQHDHPGQFGLTFGYRAYLARCGELLVAECVTHHPPEYARVAEQEEERRKEKRDAVDVDLLDEFQRSGQRANLVVRWYMKKERHCVEK